jgi:hypothetical protein
VFILKATGSAAPALTGWESVIAAVRRAVRRSAIPGFRE